MHLLPCSIPHEVLMIYGVFCVSQGGGGLVRYVEEAKMEVPMTAFYYDPFCKIIDCPRQYN
jgi:hypothetical protein